MTKTYSQYGEEAIIDSFFKGKRRGYCVDVGAADGVLYSNSRYLIETLAWSALLIEPHPAFFQSLLDLYKDNSKVRLENVAVYSDSGEMPFYLYGRDYRAQVSTLSETFRERVCNIHGDRYEAEPVTVQVTTLENILKGTERVDFLSIDCEGVDMEVLRSNDWINNKPAMVCVEHSMPKQELDDFMIKADYSLYQRTIGNSFYTCEV